MASTDNPYRRLPGTGYRYLVPGWAIVLLFFIIGIFVLLLRGRRVQLWQGPEHVLLVEWDGAREYYKRFDYRDIQAITLLRTNEGTILNAVMGALFCIFAVLGIATGDVAWRVFLLILAGIFGLIFAINALSGPTCVCSIRTAVQTDVLPSLNRMRLARKALDRLRPLIESAQGARLAAGEIGMRMRQEAAPASGSPAGSAPLVFDDPNAPPRII